ncbi:MAG: ATP-dependent DNA helicase RecG, partial [Calditrichaeota bacterium]
PAIHFPADFDALESARRRLKFDEFFYFQLMLANRRHHQKDIEGISFAHVGEKTRQLLASLPFELTDAQKRVLSEIRVDLKSVRVMNRLLQGDVGSGKTIVALIVMTIAVENGYQAALMAPTEILAEQHFLTLHHRLERLGIHPVLLTGGLKKKERETTLAEIASAKAQIVIGTHALIQESVEFSRLGLIVIDEQHRFGVLQRATLREKGMNPDLLVMTATPIPRTLSMTVYGDLDVSILNQSPVGRKPIITSWRPSSGRRKIYEFVRRQAAAGDQAYIVFPLVEESEKSDLKAAIESYEIMRSTFFKDFSLGLIHGRMTAAEKESIMNAFKAGETHILVSTTVIEVGVDVPNAAVMVVEHAERFGLTQLHQLRGRVGRGEKQSYCILVAYGALSDKTRQRLDIMVETTDGFKIAEKDLELRGPGDYLGTKQSGLPEFVIADVVYDRELLIEARAEAFALYEHQSAAARAAEIGMNNYFAKRYYQDAEFS